MKNVKRVEKERIEKRKKKRKNKKEIAKLEGKGEIKKNMQ